MLTLYMVQRMDAKATDPAACASPEAATPPSLAAPAVAGAQTARPVVAVAHGPGSTWPEMVTVTIAGVAHVVDVSGDRDDWQLPEVDDAIAHRVLWAIEDAIEVWLRATEPVVSRRERTWARRVA